MNADTRSLVAGQDVQDFISANEGQDEAALLLKNQQLFGIPFAVIAQQLHGRRKARERLPTFFSTRGIIYPLSLNLEQCSSEATANYRNSLVESIIQQRESVADLTGGFGVDSLFFSKLFSTVHSVEPNADLLEIARHNHNVLHATNISHHALTAENFLASTPWTFDLIYIDPSRRNEQNKKLFRLADTQPNVVELLPKLLARTQFILVKASPFLDIQQGLSELMHVEKVVVVAVRNECKELLFLVNKNYTQEPNVIAVDLSSSGDITDQFVFRLSVEKLLNTLPSPPLQYLYEPHAAILKAGAFKSIATIFGVQKIQTNTHLYTSNLLVADFPGRVFEIKALQPQANELNQWLPDGKANVITRNYPLSAEELKRKLKLKDGGDNYVIGFSEENRKTIAIATRIK